MGASFFVPFSNCHLAPKKLLRTWRSVQSDYVKCGSCFFIQKELHAKRSKQKKNIWTVFSRLILRTLALFGNNSINSLSQVWPQPNFTRQTYTEVLTSNISQALLARHSILEQVSVRLFLPLFLYLVSFQKTSAGPTGSTTIHHQLVTVIPKPALAHARVQLPSPVRPLMGYQCLTLSLIRPRAQVAESRAWIVTRERIEVAQISKFVTSAPAHVSIKSLSGTVYTRIYDLYHCVNNSVKGLFFCSCAKMETSFLPFRHLLQA